MLDRMEVAARVEALSEYVSARDWEAAAHYEWRLWEDVLRAVAGQSAEGSALAELALRTLRYQYPRCW